MGEMAEMMTSGILCQICGEYLELEDPPDVPLWCPECAPDDAPEALVSTYYRKLTTASDPDEETR